MNDENAQIIVTFRRTILIFAHLVNAQSNLIWMETCLVWKNIMLLVLTNWVNATHIEPVISAWARQKTELFLQFCMNVTASRLPVFLLQLVSLPSKYQRWYVPCKISKFRPKSMTIGLPTYTNNAWDGVTASVDYWFGRNGWYFGGKVFRKSNNIGNSFRGLCFDSNWTNRDYCYCVVCSLGERAQTTPHFLQKVQMPQAAQGHPIQEVQGTQLRPGSSSLRS